MKWHNLLFQGKAETGLFKKPETSCWFPPSVGRCSAEDTNHMLCWLLNHFGRQQRWLPSLRCKERSELHTLRGETLSLWAGRAVVNWSLFGCCFIPCVKPGEGSVVWPEKENFSIGRGLYHHRGNTTFPVLFLLTKLKSGMPDSFSKSLYVTFCFFFVFRS